MHKRERRPYCKHALALVGLSCVTALSGVAASGAYASHNNDHGHDIIIRDICIIGGGAAGTYAAIRLGDMNQSVIVVERTDRLGGNTQTFTDPVTQIKADIGVQVWHNLDIVKNFFSRFNVPLTIMREQSNVEFIDFASGAQLNSYPADQGNMTAALQAYAVQLTKYPFLDGGFELPDPVPTDLLIPFSDFVAKYNLSAAMTPLMDYSQGLGSFMSYPTIYLMKLVGLSILEGIQNGFLTTARHDNSEIYRNAQAFLLAANSLLLHSSVISTERGQDGLVKLMVSTPSGYRAIKVKKIIFAIPPTLENLHNFDIDSEEHSVFKQFSTTGYYTGLLRNSGIPANIGTLSSRGFNTKFHVPILPNIYTISPSTIPGLRYVLYGSDTILPVDQVTGNIITTVQKIFPNVTATAPPEFAVFSSHSPFMFTVPPSAIEAGFYRNLSKLQGYRHMYYTGGAFQTQDSSLIWQFTEALLGRVVI